MEALIHRAKAGDPVALEQLLESVAPSIQRFGARMCKNEHDSEDVLQDTLITVLNHLHEYEGRSSFMSWLFALTRSACNRRRRGLKNAPGVPLEMASEPAETGRSPEERAADRELGQHLSRALDELTDEYREVILLRDMEGLNASEAAESLAITVDALKSRLHRARQALRAALKPQLEVDAPEPSRSCPDIMAMWSRKLDGDLSALDCAEMERHLVSCKACAATCNALKTALVACRQETAKPVRPEVQASVKAAVRRFMSALRT